MNEPRPTVEQLRALRVVDLRQKLSALGITQSGKKEDLVQRLNNHYDKLEQEQQLMLQQQHFQPQPGYVDPHQQALLEQQQQQQRAAEEAQAQAIALAQAQQAEADRVRQEQIRMQQEEQLRLQQQEHERQQLEAQAQARAQAEAEAAARAQAEAAAAAAAAAAEQRRMQEAIRLQQEQERQQREAAERQAAAEAEAKARAQAEAEAAEQARQEQLRVQEELRRQQELEREAAAAAEAQRLQAEEQARREREQAEIEQAEREQQQKRTLFKALIPAPPMANLASGPPLAASDHHQVRQEHEPEPVQEEPDLNESSSGMKLADISADSEDNIKDTKQTAGGKNKKKKKKKKNRPEEWARQAAEAERKRQEAEEAEKEKPDVEVEYIQEKLDLDMSDPMYRQFSKIFDAFKLAEDDEERLERERKAAEAARLETRKVPKLLEADDMIEEKDEEVEENKMSKRKMKQLNRLSVAELKQLVNRPDVVEMHDVTAKDPGLLVHLKSTRNTVPVPRHWCFKRKYLQGKRGIEKPPFDLPEFIKKTGIMEMRAALQEKEEAKGLKSKMREKVRPKLGKIDIDYQKLHDAFFKWQTKPRMTHHGDLYYEGKEFEIRLKEKKPGDLTDDLRTALGMPVGPNAYKVPPPWLISMQRYGPPPSYPNLKIPGLNAPIPDACSFGYHAGGWGKPPVDESGKPLYGDVFGTSDSSFAQNTPIEEVDQTLWGEMESESEEEESEEEEEEEAEGEEEEKQDLSGMQTPVVDAGLATPSGMSSVGGPGQETPELIELRKRKIEADMEGGETPNLYTVLPERKADKIGASMMGSTHTYELPSAAPPGAPKRADPGAVEMALNPDEVDMMGQDENFMQAKAEAALREQQAALAKEDLSDMVAEHAAKQSNKRKRMANKEETKSGKKYKEFKF